MIKAYGDRGEKGSTVKMSIGYAIPGFLGQLLDNHFIDRVVESTLHADLERFGNMQSRQKQTNEV